jgi:octaprenyl-diphosphate synthase
VAEDDDLSYLNLFPGRAPRGLQDPVFSPTEIFALVTDPLQQVERLFRESLASPVHIIHEIGHFVAEGGGKRVRPALRLLSARLCGYSGPHDVLLATVLECIHSATLIHDDIIDDATTRRGRPSVNRRWGNNVTVLFGDYLYAKAMEMALRAKNLRVMEKLAEITLRMTEGEMLQTRYVGRLDLGVSEYLDLIERKTAALFAGCCELAGILAGVGREREHALYRYGLNLGLAFQVVDDLLDFTGDPKTLGKPAASDLREGKVTLALIELLDAGSTRGRELAAAILASGLEDTEAISELTRLLHERGAIAKAHRRAQHYAAEATRELRLFPDSPARQALQTVPDLILFRDR